HGGPPITTPASLAAALARVVPAPAPPPAMPPTVMRPPRPGPGPANPWETSGGPAAPWAGNGGRPMPRGALPSQRPGSNRMLTGVVVALVLVAIVVGAWLLSQRGPSHSTAASNHPTQQATTPVSVVLKPVSATAFGPQGGDNQDQAASAIDGKPGNGWQTDAYKGSPFFGNLYKGTGLLVDMGKPVNVESVTITFGQSPGSDVRLEMGDSNTGADNTGANPAGFTTIAKANNVSGPMTFTARAVGAHQYLLIWFTKLAPTNGGEFQADVSNITVRGTG
ncbi:MAG TPA: hypothetical protein VGS19_24805, partial [Streptosporangiaceae bacterium]|nr:hypothetical protein [Streptosporangiaceae bacterium]